MWPALRLDFPKLHTVLLAEANVLPALVLHQASYKIIQCDQVKNPGFKRWLPIVGKRPLKLEDLLKGAFRMLKCI